MFVHPSLLYREKFSMIKIEVFETEHVYRGHFNVVNNGTITGGVSDPNEIWLMTDRMLFAGKNGIMWSRNGEYVRKRFSIFLFV